MNEPFRYPQYFTTPSASRPEGYESPVGSSSQIQSLHTCLRYHRVPLSSSLSNWLYLGNSIELSILNLLKVDDKWQILDFECV